jgi:hypothetical protein
VSGTREQALEFCNRFNLNLIICRAQVRDLENAGGGWTVIFDYDHVVFEDERIEPKSIVRLTRKFGTIVRNGITRYDQDKIF